MIFRDKHGSLPIYKNYKKMLENEDLDILSIATPATCHAEMVIAAVEAGVKAILCEKAMATSLLECDKMISTCENNGTILAINHQRRWDDRFRGINKLIKKGEIGKLQSIQISFGGGQLCRKGSHFFDLALMFCNDAISTGCGWLSNPETFDSGGVGLFETISGIRIAIDGSNGLNHILNVDIIGNQGIIRIFDDILELELWTLHKFSEFGHLSKRHFPINFPVKKTMYNILDDIIHCIENGGQTLDSGYDGRSSFEMIAAIYQSNYNNREFVSFPVKERER